MKRTKKIALNQYISQLYYNPVENIQKLVNIEANKSCRIWSDQHEKNQLEFSQTPLAPFIEPPKKIEFSSGLYNFIKIGILSLRP